MSECLYEESGMDFRFNDEYDVQLEKSAGYSKIEGKSVRACDFVVKHRTKQNVVLLIEAKTSAPRTENAAGYFKEIEEKFIHSLLMLTATKINRAGFGEFSIPKQLSDYMTADVKIIPVLIVRKSQSDWTSLLKAKINKSFEGYRCSFGIEPIEVLDEAIARKKKYIV